MGEGDGKALFPELPLPLDGGGGDETPLPHPRPRRGEGDGTTLSPRWGERKERGASFPERSGPPAALLTQAPRAPWPSWPIRPGRRGTSAGSRGSRPLTPSSRPPGSGCSAVCNASVMADGVRFRRTAAAWGSPLPNEAMTGRVAPFSQRKVASSPPFGVLSVSHGK